MPDRPGPEPAAKAGVFSALPAGRIAWERSSAAFAFSSFRVGDVTTHGPGGGIGDRLAFENRFQQIFQIMLCRFGPLLPQINIAIVDPTMVSEPAAGKKDRRFGCDVYLA